MGLRALWVGGQSVVWSARAGLPFEGRGPSWRLHGDQACSFSVKQQRCARAMCMPAGPAAVPVPQNPPWRVQPAAGRRGEAGL